MSGVLYRASVRRSGAELGDKILLASSFSQRLVGLLGRKGLLPGEGLILPETTQVHMFGMKFTIDALFLSPSNEVLRIVSDLRPWRVSPLVRKARTVVELPSGIVEPIGVTVGDIIDISPAA